MVNERVYVAVNIGTNDKLQNGLSIFINLQLRSGS